ncbi:50S ribosomal protein L10 [Candidatus Dojkabacteria bacterium]|nr:50S ribosomal protein L10 [Candidatus Dojkabacteria bacterium]
MALTKKGKQDIVDDYKSKLEAAEAVFVIQPKGISPNEASEFKKILSEKNASFNVVKNTLFKIAVEKSDKKITIGDGENAVVFSGGDAVDVAKALSDFIKATDKAEFRTALVENQEIDFEQFATLSNLPSREVLLAQVLATMQAPVTGFVRVLNGNLSGFMNVLNAIKDQKGS